VCRMAETIEQIRERALAKAERLGHDMQVLAGGPDTAFYTWRSANRRHCIDNPVPHGSRDIKMAN
jgi:hypothetical protein